VPPVRTRALVLQAFPYSETSKILRLLTREHGVRSVIAKGALRPKSRYGGLLEPFTEGEAQFYLREGRDLHTLAGFDLVRSRQGIGSSLVAFAGASLLAELVLRTATEEPHAELFDSLTAAFDELGYGSREPGRLETLVFGAIWRVVAMLGFLPEVHRCVGCDRPLEPDESARFDLQGGGFACRRCRPAGRLIPPADRADLVEMIAGAEIAALRDPTMHRALLRAFLATHLGHDRPLRALPLLLQELEST
jgi:DNA repair protein RecO (recombination protein O)